MALKKQDRKDKLVEIYNILAKTDNEHATEARKKIIDMLSHDGLFILEKDDWLRTNK